MGSSYSCYTLNPSYSPFHLQRVLFVFRKPRFHSWPSIFSAFISCAAARRRFQCTFSSFFAASKPKASGTTLAKMCTSAQRPFCYSVFRYSVIPYSVIPLFRIPCFEDSLSRPKKVDHSRQTTFSGHCKMAVGSGLGTRLGSPCGGYRKTKNGGI